jgi:hypothetical protein
LNRLAEEIGNRGQEGLDPDLAELNQWARLVEGLLRDDP